MKKITLLAIFALALLLVPSALADRNRETITFFDAVSTPVDNVQMVAYKCTDTNNECRTVEPNPVVNANSGSSNTITTTLPQTQRKTDYAQYFTKSGFLPMRNVAFDLQANQRFTYSVNFVKKALCEANIGPVSSPIIPIQPGQSFSVVAPVQSAFNPSGNAPFFIPDHLKNEFYATQTDVVLTLTNAANPAVTVSVTKQVNPFAGAIETVAFDNLQNLQLPPGVYNGEVSTTVVDDQCALTAVKTVQLSQQVVLGSPNAPPVIIVNPTPPFTIAENQTLVFTVTTSDPEGDQVTLSLSNVPQGAGFNAQGVFTWTPTAAQSGTHQVTITAVDAVGSVATQTVTITVVDVLSAPVITSTPVLTAAVNTLYTYDVNAFDSEGKTITYSLALGPTGMTIDSATGLIQWTPTAAQAGPNNVDVRAATAGGSTAQQFTINVADPNQLLNDFLIIPANPVANELVTFIAQNPNGQGRVFSWNFGDVLSAQNTASGMAATHTFRTAATYSVSLVITNDDGSTNTVTKFVIVSEEKRTQRDRVTLTRVNMPDIVFRGSQVPMRIEIFNDAKGSLNDARITVLQYDLDVRQSLGPFDISSGDSKSKTLFVSIPEDAPQGEYDIEIRLSNDDKHRVIYRTVMVY